MIKKESTHRSGDGRLADTDFPKIKNFSTLKNFLNTQSNFKILIYGTKNPKKQILFKIKEIQIENRLLQSLKYMISLNLHIQIPNVDGKATTEKIRKGFKPIIFSNEKENKNSEN